MSSSPLSSNDRDVKGWSLTLCRGARKNLASLKEDISEGVSGTGPATPALEEAEGAAMTNYVYRAVHCGPCCPCCVLPVFELSV